MNIKHNKIAFVGYAGSGKDFYADYLIKEHNYTRIAFADSVKKFTHELLPEVKEHYTHEEKDKPINLEIAGKLVTKTPREIWIDLSRPILEVDSDFFLRRTKKEIESTEKIIITDVRRIEEYQYLKDQGFLIIYIEAGLQCTNDFDKLILDFRDDLCYNFDNDFNGLEAFKQYISQI